MYIIRRK